MYKIETVFPLEGYMDTRIGGREENQDSCGFSDTPLGTLIVVCDGMGGLNGGATASAVAVSKVIEIINAADSSDNPVEVIRTAVLEANLAVINKGLEDPSLLGMGTTLTLVLINKDCAYATYVGDSRIYQLRKGKKVYRTFDDSVVFQLVKLGSLTEEEARTAGNSNVITRALGVSEDLTVDVKRLSYDKHDRFVLCTDGFWGNMPEKKLLSLIGKTGGTGSLELTFERAINKVEIAGRQEKEGKHDNLTVAVVDVKKYSKYRTKMEKIFKLATIVLSVLLVASLCCLALQYNASKSESSELKTNLSTAVDSAKVALESANKQIEGISKENKSLIQENESLKKTIESLKKANADQAKANATPPKKASEKSQSKGSKSNNK